MIGHHAVRHVCAALVCCPYPAQVRGRPAALESRRGAWLLPSRTSQGGMLFITPKADYIWNSQDEGFKDERHSDSAPKGPTFALTIVTGVIIY